MKKQNFGLIIDELENVLDTLFIFDKETVQSDLKKEEPSIEPKKEESSTPFKEEPSILPKEEPTTSSSKEHLLQKREENVNIYAKNSSKEIKQAKVKGDYLSAPKKPTLQHYREWEKAFKPLKITSIDKRKKELDVDNTVEWIAQTDIFQLLYNQKLKKHFTLTLVIDKHHSIDIFNSLIIDFCNTIEHYGIFEGIYYFYLDGVNEQTSLYRDRYLKQKVKASSIMRSDENLILILSSCISPAWRSNSVYQDIYTWSKQNFCSIVQMLPSNMWLSTTLKEGNKLAWKSMKMSPKNFELYSKKEPFYFDETTKILKIPIISFEHFSFKAWSSVVIGSRQHAISGIGFEIEKIKKDKEVKSLNLNSKERLDNFLSQASSTAKLLSAYLANNHVSFEIARIIQELKLKDSSLSHISEVFLGGIIEKKVIEGKTSYDFHEGIRDTLKHHIAPQEALELFNQTSKFVSEYFDTAQKIPSMIQNPNSIKEIPWDDNMIAFAKIGIDILKRKGGIDYSRAIAFENELLGLGEDKVKIKTIIPKSKRFMMGAYENDNTQPIHEVILNYDFEVAKYPVTVEEFRTFIKSTGYKTNAEVNGGGMVYFSIDEDWTQENNASWKNPYFEQTGKHPVVCISWNDTKAYIEWLNNETKESYRLPSESEWEFLCRANTSTKWYFGDNKEDIIMHGWYKKNSKYKTHPVGEKSKNPWGLYDLYGNVWEWCEDNTSLDYTDFPIDGSAYYGEFEKKILRGGSWLYDSNKNTSYTRGHHFISSTFSNFGFRLVQSISKDFYKKNNQMIKIINSLSIDTLKIPNKNYEMGKYPITIAEYMHFVKDIDSHYPEWVEDDSKYKNMNLSDNAPIIGVSWYDAVAYCKWLSEKTGKKYKLPSKEKWEYAGKEGNIDKWKINKNINDYAWYKQNSNNSNHIVGEKLPNKFGLYDMIGNVWEWTDNDKENEIICGASYNVSLKGSSLSLFDKRNKNYRSTRVGFRISCLNEDIHQVEIINRIIEQLKSRGWDDASIKKNYQVTNKFTADIILLEKYSPAFLIKYNDQNISRLTKKLKSYTQNIDTYITDGKRIYKYNSLTNENILVNQFPAPQATVRIDLKMQSLLGMDEEKRKIILSILLLNLMGEKCTLSLIKEIFNERDFKKVVDHKYFYTFFSILEEEEIVINKMDYMQDFEKYIHSYFTPKILKVTLMELIEKFSSYPNKNLISRGIYKNLLRYEFIKKIAPKETKKLFIDNYFKKLMKIMSLNNEPMYWVQYSSFNIEYMNYDEAQKNLNIAYKRVNSKDGYDISFIDTQQARLHLLLATEISIHEISAFKIFQKANNILELYDYNRYTTKIISKYKDFYISKFSYLSENDKNSFLKIVESHYQNIQNFVYGNIHISQINIDTTCVTNLKYILDEKNNIQKIEDTVINNPLKANIRWWGNWEAEKDKNWYEQDLFITRVDENGFDFELICINGLHIGNINGYAKFISLNKAKFENTEEDEKEICRLYFHNINETIKITEENCSEYHGVKAYFDGKYELKKDIFVKYNKMVDDRVLSDIYGLIGKNYWERFQQCFDGIRGMNDLDNLGIDIIVGTISNSNSINESILMIDADKNIWGAFINDEDDKVYYFASLLDWKNTLPKTVDAWRENFKEKELVFIDNLSIKDNVYQEFDNENKLENDTTSKVDDYNLLIIDTNLEHLNIVKNAFTNKGFNSDRLFPRSIELEKFISDIRVLARDNKILKIRDYIIQIIKNFNIDALIIEPILGDEEIKHPNDAIGSKLIAELEKIDEYKKLPILVLSQIRKYAMVDNLIVSDNILLAEKPYVMNHVEVESVLDEEIIDDLTDGIIEYLDFKTTIRLPEKITLSEVKENLHDEILQNLLEIIHDEFKDYSLEADYLPDGIDEVRITELYMPEELKFIKLIKNDDTYILNIEFETEALVWMLVDRNHHDYMSLKPLPVRDHNKQYYNAESEEVLYIELSVEFKIDKNEQIRDLVIDSIDDVVLIEDEHSDEREQDIKDEISNEITHILKTEHLKGLDFYQIHDESLPSDDSSALINSYDLPKKVEIEDIEIFSNQFDAKVYLEQEVYLDINILKNEYYSNDEYVSLYGAVEELNKHYVTVEGHALIAIELGIQGTRDKEIDSMEALNIDIVDISVVELIPVNNSIDNSKFNKLGFINRVSSKEFFEQLKDPIKSTSMQIPNFYSENMIKSKIDGNFNGWNGKTIIKLINGEKWKQSSSTYSYSYAYNPEVIIYKSDYGYKMKVDGNDEVVDVERYYSL